MTLDECLAEMHRIYAENPVKAVRGQGFIKVLHEYLAADLKSRLTPLAVKKKVEVKKEPTIFGSHKPKDVDVAVIEPNNGPLLIVGVRSQMSSVTNNVLTYYEGIIGECIGLQDRFPMAVIGYVYLHPLKPVKEGKEDEALDHPRYARMYEAISSRSGLDYMSLRGIFDQFAYMIIDFEKNPPAVCDALVQHGTPTTDMRVSTFVDRMVTTFKSRNLYIDFFK